MVNILLSARLSPENSRMTETRSLPLPVDCSPTFPISFSNNRSQLLLNKQNSPDKALRATLQCMKVWGGGGGQGVYNVHTGHKMPDTPPELRVNQCKDQKDAGLADGAGKGRDVPELHRPNSKVLRLPGQP